ncbi:hypothetical protein PG993_012272 [Apiospora rasikravindrae]|uniref:Uncharacterized protein n=1 Tax=Apiospora rasikravindrae TaxID=990691 RepID=A0ABR1S1W9_9PEZI
MQSIPVPLLARLSTAAKRVASVRIVPRRRRSLHHRVCLDVLPKHRTDKGPLHRVVVHNVGQHLLLLREGFRLLGPLCPLVELRQGSDLLLVVEHEFQGLLLLRRERGNDTMLGPASLQRLVIDHITQFPLRYGNAKRHGRKVLESVRPVERILSSHLAMEEETLGDTLAHGHDDLFVHGFCDAICCGILLFEEEEYLVADGHVPSSDLFEVPPLPLRANPGDLVLTAMVHMGDNVEPPGWASDFRFAVGHPPVVNL